MFSHSPFTRTLSWLFERSMLGKLQYVSIEARANSYLQFSKSNGGEKTASSLEPTPLSKLNLVAYVFLLITFFR